RYQSELGSADGGSAAAYTLVADIRRVPAQPRLADALILLARRADEERLFDEALAAASEAEALLSAAGDEAAVRKAQRLRGGALLCLQRFDDAFAVLDPVMTRPDRALGGASRFGGIS